MLNSFQEVVTLGVDFDMVDAQFMGDIFLEIEESLQAIMADGC